MAKHTGITYFPTNGITTTGAKLSQRKTGKRNAETEAVRKAQNQNSNLSRSDQAIINDIQKSRRK